MNADRSGIRGVLVLIAGCAVWLSAGRTEAQMPHRVAVLVNENSQDSKKAANVFAAAHGVPGINLIALELPAALVSGRAECTPEEFLSLIYEPARKTIEARGLGEQITAWVYSVDFPIRIVTSPSDRRQMSLMGLTFTRGIVPSMEMIEKGQYLSPLFAGPVKEGGPKNASRSFDVMHATMKENLPLPSMMLGYTGENGTDMATVLRCIENGVRARQTGGKPPVVFWKTADAARSGPREWQFAEVRSELAARGATAEVVTNRPAGGGSGRLGLMTGAESLKPADFGPFAPGAFAEHMTSWSAEFQKPQTKCTEWLKAGATVTAGMVTEPYNAWPKFPHARFFVHYVSGCSAMESFYQSILSPVQILLLGDPLAQITGLPAAIKTVGLSKTVSSELDAAFVAEAKLPIAAPVLYSALLNGRQIKAPEGNTLIELPFNEMGDGWHEVRIIAQAMLPVTPGGFADFPVFISRKGRSVKISGMAEGGAGRVVVRVAAAGSDAPQELALLWNGLELDRKSAAGETELMFDERTVGEGPHRLQAVAWYADGMEVRSEPSSFAIAFKRPAE